MNKQNVQSKRNYLAPKAEVFPLGANLSFLVQSFSHPGDLTDLVEGDELGLDENGQVIGARTENP